MATTRKSAIRREPVAQEIAPVEVEAVETSLVEEPVKAAPVEEAVKEPEIAVPPQLSPEATVTQKMKELEAHGKADLSTGQRIGARLLAMSELRNS